MPMEACAMSTLRLAALLLASAPAMAAGPNLGQPLTHGDLAAWEIHAYPDGKGLPPGSGTMAQRAPLFAQKCAHCHGEAGKGAVDAALGCAPPINALDATRTILNVGP